MMNRREALTRLGGLVAGGWLTSRAAAQSASSSLVTSASANIASPASGQSFTLAHITDVHLREDREAPRWFAKCLHDIQSHEKKPAMVMNTGDSIWDSLKVDRQRADALWKLWNDSLKNELSLPIHHALGNHDVWGLRRPDGDPSKSDPLYGKKLALEKLGMEMPYHSFDYGNWHFVFLDCIFPDVNEAGGWYTRLDDEQFQWLKADLAAVDPSRPVAVYSHVPIIQAAAMLHMKPNKDKAYTYGRHGVFSDARRIIDLFKKHPNVKLCYSGHVHLRDRVEIGGVTYICDGAVCGRWWLDVREFSPPGYSITTFHPDGKFEHEYSGYGWEKTPGLEVQS